MDAVAALITFWAVSVAERPADVEHQYGHGKAQNLSALGEAILLGAAAGWVAVEALSRLRSSGGGLDPAAYTFALMLGVLLVDAARATISLRQARSARSAAMLASGWHFASDFVGTLAVLAGLVLSALGYGKADAAAALFVAVIVLVAAVRLAARNVHPLMDRAPAGLADRIHGAVADVPGVSEVRAVRVREAGGEYFADVVIGIPRLQGLERSHDTMDEVEEVVEREVGRSRVTVHAEPTARDERANERVTAASLRVPGVVEVHNITVLEDRPSRVITLHARVDADLPLGEAAAIVQRLKDEIESELAATEVYVHLEPFAPDAQGVRDVTTDEPGLFATALAAARSVAPGASVVVYRREGRCLVVVSLPADASLSVREAHALAGRVEEAVRAALPDVDDVIVEVSEPAPSPVERA